MLCRKLEEEKVRSQENVFSNNNNKSNGNSGGVAYNPQLKIYELRAEKYNGMVRLLKPGCRTLILLLDPQSKPALLPPFHKAVWPYRKSVIFHNRAQNVLASITFTRYHFSLVKYTPCNITSFFSLRVRRLASRSSSKTRLLTPAEKTTRDCKEYTQYVFLFVYRYKWLLY